MTSRGRNAIAAAGLVRTFVPGFRVMRKSDSAFMRLVASVLFFVPDFMNSFSTTIGYTAYLTDDALERIGVILHEGRHAYQSQQWTRPFMALAYLFPQILGIGFAFASLAWLVIAAFVGWSWWQLVPLCGLLFLAPLPAYFRMRLELDAYTVSMAVQFWTTGKISSGYLNSVAEHFVSGDYYFMWPFRAAMTKRIVARAAWASSLHALKDDPYFEAIYKWMSDNDLLVTSPSLNLRVVQ